jgi:hypothetical protein
MSTTSLDIVAGESNNAQRLGRAWINEKDGKVSFRLSLNSMPLPQQAVRLINTEKSDIGALAAEYNVTVPVPRKDQKDYFHSVGRLTRVPGDGGVAYELHLASMPMSGNLVAFEKDQ